MFFYFVCAGWLCLDLVNRLFRDLNYGKVGCWTRNGGQAENSPKPRNFETKNIIHIFIYIICIFHLVKKTRFSWVSVFFTFQGRGASPQIFHPG